MAGIVGLFVLLSMVFVLSSRPDVVVHKRIAPYTDSKKRAKAELDDGEPAKIPMLTQLFISTERIVGSMNFWRRMSACSSRPTCRCARPSCSTSRWAARCCSA